MAKRPTLTKKAREHFIELISAKLDDTLGEWNPAYLSAELYVKSGLNWQQDVVQVKVDLSFYSDDIVGKELKNAFLKSLKKKFVHVEKLSDWNRGLDIKIEHMYKMLPSDSNVDQFVRGNLEVWKNYKNEKKRRYEESVRRNRTSQ